MAGDSSELVWSVKNGDLAEVKHLLEKGANVGVVVNGRTLLHYAADFGQAEVVEYLIEKGADVNAPDKYGVTPLLSAIFEGHTPCVKTLLKLGANKNGKSPEGLPYVECADKEDIKILLK